MSFLKIGERTFWDQQGLESSEYVAYRSWDKTVPNAGHVNQIFSPVISNYDGVHSMGTRNMTFSF